MKKTFLSFILLLFAGFVLAFEPFTFALLTDTHISRGNPIPLEDLNNSVADINKNPNIRFVVVSGDVTESGDSLSIVAAKEALDKLNVPYYAASGNHETKWSDSGCRDFAVVFGADRFYFEYGGCAFIGFNSGPVIKMADGHVAPQDISWMESKLKALPAGTPVFPITHYPLKEGDVDNWYQVTDVLRQYNVQCLLGGHYHTNRVYMCDGLADVLHRSNLRAKDPIGGYSIITVSEDSIRWQEKVIDQEPIQWLSMPFGPKTYDAPDPALRPSFAVNEEYKNVTEAWQTAVGVGMYAMPAADKKNAYIGDDTGTFYAFSLKNGKEVWRFQTGSRIVSSACVADGKVVFGSTDGYIYCLKACSGKLLWKVQTPKAVMGCALEHNGIVYIGGSDGCMRALNMQDGSSVWTAAVATDYIESKPCIYNDKLYFGAWDCNLYALNLADGSLAWKWNNGKTNNKLSPAAVWPVVANGKVFITAPDRYFTAVDAETGETVWRTKEHVVRETVGLSEDGKRVYSKCMWDYIVAMDATTAEPVTVWNTNCGYDYDHNPAMLIEKDGVVVVGTKNGLLMGLDAFTGAILWKHKIGNSVLNTAVPLGNGDWLVSSSEGTLTRVCTQK